MNIAQAKLVRDDGATWLELDRGESRLRVPDAALDAYPRAATLDGAPVAIGMRPEHFAPAQKVDADQVWKGRNVSLVEMLGAEMLVHFDTDSAPIVTDDMREAIDDEEAFEELKRRAAEGGQSFTARFEPGPPPKMGAAMDVGFRTEHLHFFDVETGEALR
jgi:multiple sugar transport system ATP-binding protein